MRCEEAPGHFVSMNPELMDLVKKNLDRVEDSSSPPALMLASLRELDRLVSESGAAMPGDLAHYLSRRSYAKARLFLFGAGKISAGSCGRGV